MDRKGDTTNPEKEETDRKRKELDGKSVKNGLVYTPYKIRVRCLHGTLCNKNYISSIRRLLGKLSFHPRKLWRRLNLAAVRPMKTSSLRSLAETRRGPEYQTWSLFLNNIIRNTLSFLPLGRPPSSFQPIFLSFSHPRISAEITG